MKRWKNFVSWGIILSFYMAVFLTLGCEDKGTGPEEPLGIVDALTIICNPLAPEPGEIARLTVQAIPAGGKVATYDWTVEAGTLIVDEGISVTWQVPDTAGVFHVEVRASLDQSRDTLSKDIMVRNFERIEWIYNDGEGQQTLSTALRPVILPDGFYCTGHYSFDYNPEYRYHVIQKSGVSTNCKTRCDALVGGDHFQFFPDVNRILGSMLVNFSGYFRLQRMDVWSFPTLGFGSPINITISDESDVGTPQRPVFRKNQHIHPVGNQNLDMAVWQQNIAGESLDGTQDLANIGFSNAARWSSSWQEGDPPTFMTLTESYYLEITMSGTELDTNVVYYKNILPQITPLEDYVIYFVDTTGTFEPCMIPITGNEPDTTQRRALMIDPDHGIFWQRGVEVGENTVFQWSPVGDLLGFIDQRSYICQFDYTAEDVDRLTGLGKVSEFAWSPDGSRVAAISENGVIISSLGGIPRIIFEKERATDEIYGINWSNDPDDLMLGFRVVRKGRTTDDSWSSIVIWSEEDPEDWYYATPVVHWPGEPLVDDYTWMRVVFEPDSDGLYVPIPVADLPGRNVVIYHSY